MIRFLSPIDLLVLAAPLASVTDGIPSHKYVRVQIRNRTSAPLAIRLCGRDSTSSLQDTLQPGRARVCQVHDFTPGPAKALIEFPRRSYVSRWLVPGSYEIVRSGASLRVVGPWR